MITFAVVGALFMFVSEICVFIYPCYKVIHTKKVVVGVVLVVCLILGGKCTYVYKREYLILGGKCTYVYRREYLILGGKCTYVYKREYLSNLVCM